MATLDARREQELGAYARDVRSALGDACISIVLYGSAAGVDWIVGRSDFNTIIVLRRASAEVSPSVVVRRRASRSSSGRACQATDGRAWAGDASPDRSAIRAIARDPARRVPDSG